MEEAQQQQESQQEENQFPPSHHASDDHPDHTSNHSHDDRGDGDDGDHDGDHFDDDHAAPLFFADMQLDLAEAHDIAETPEPKQRKLVIEPGNVDVVHTLAPHMPIMSPSSSTPVNSNSSNEDEDEGDHNKASTTTQQQHQPQFYGHHNPQDDDYMPQVLGRVTSSDPGMSTPHNSRSASNVLMRSAGGSRRTRLWSKDVVWALSFIIIVPISLTGPLLLGRGKQNQNDEDDDDDDSASSTVWLATARAPRLATLHTLLWGFAAALILARILYRTAGGGDGDDARHFASQILLASAPISVSVYIFLLVAIYWMAPHGTWMFSLIPLWYLGRDVYLFRRWKMTSTTPGGRQSFFQALTCMTLDILSRSLRRLPFWRCVLASLVVQFFVIAWFGFG